MVNKSEAERIYEYAAIGIRIWDPIKKRVVAESNPKQGKLVWMRAGDECMSVYEDDLNDFNKWKKENGMDDREEWGEDWEDKILKELSKERKRCLI